MPVSGRSHNEESPLHPHEPEIPPALDAEGRCLVCGLRVEIERLREDLTETQAHARNGWAAVDDLVDVLDDAVRMEFHGTGLAQAILVALDRDRERTGVDEWDESDVRCFAYNAAAAVLEGRDPREA